MILKEPVADPNTEKKLSLPCDRFYPFSLGNISDDESDENFKSALKAPETMVMFKRADNNKIIAISLKSIISVQGENLKTTWTQKIMKHSLQIYYKNQSNSNGWGVMKYLTFGIVWVPSYE